jgi:hypothetical protein
VRPDLKHETRADRLKREQREADEMNQALLQHASDFERELLAAGVDLSDDEAIKAYAVS